MIRASSHQYRPQHPADEWSRTQITVLCSIEGPWRAREDTRNNDGAANIPSIQQSGRNDCVTGRRIKQRNERPDEELEQTIR